MNISIQNIVDNINKDIKDNVIKRYKVDIITDNDNTTTISVALAVSGSYDYDNSILEEWKNLFHAYGYYVSVKNNRLFIIMLIKV